MASYTSEIDGSEKEMAMRIPQKLKNEIKAVRTAALYFWCWSSALPLVKKLILAEYQISVNGWAVEVVEARQ